MTDDRGGRVSHEWLEKELKRLRANFAEKLPARLQALIASCLPVGVTDR